MTVALWRIAATTAKYAASDMTGTGAKNTGGRWNSIGMAVTYSSENIALAVHETVVHLKSGGLPLNRYLVRIDVPDAVWAARQVLTPAVGWDALPAGMISIQAGDAWLKGLTSALLVVPSVIVPEESNVLINPQHPAAASIVTTPVRKCGTTTHPISKRYQASQKHASVFARKTEQNAAHFSIGKLEDCRMGRSERKSQLYKLAFSSY